MVEKGRYSGIRMTRKTKLAIAKRARSIISDRKRWTQGRLRRKKRDATYSYCVLGACQQASYDLQLQDIPKHGAFAESGIYSTGYGIGSDIGLSEFSERKYGREPYLVNDSNGHEGTLEMLDLFIEELENEPDGQTAGLTP